MDENTARGVVTAFIEKAKRDKYQGMDGFKTTRSNRKAMRAQLTRSITHLKSAIDDSNPCMHTIKVMEEPVAQGQYVVSDTRCPALSDCGLE